MDRDKAKRELIGHVNSIVDCEIKEFTLNMLRVAPKSYWESRSSRSHHPPDERLPGGNLIHIVRMTRLALMMAECCNLEGIDKDIIISASVLHDLCRNGLEGSSEYTLPEHPRLVKELARMNSISCYFSGAIFSIIESHMGKWGEIPYIPHMNSHIIIHLADAISDRAEQAWEELG